MMPGPPLRRHEGRVAVVTGASSGIGQGVACRLAAEGALVAVADVLPATETVSMIEEAGGRAQAFDCDVSSAESVAELKRGVTSDLGNCDILANVAGIYPLGLFEDMEWETWRRMMEVNVDALFHTCKAFLPGMIERGWGRIVNTASDSCFAPAFAVASATAYAASKSAVIGFSRALASEVGASGVTVNVLSPGQTRTARNEQLGVVGSYGSSPDESGLPDRYEPIRQQQAVKQTVVPADHAAVIAFVVSDDAALMTGHVFQVDGGWLMNT